MKIIYEDNIKKDILKQLKKFNPSSFVMKFNFDIENKKGNLSIHADKYINDSNIEIKINKTFNTDFNYNIKNLTINIDYIYDVLFNLLLENCFINCYHKNIDGIKINEGSYFMDTIIVENEQRNKRINHDKICHHRFPMIHLSE